MKRQLAIVVLLALALLLGTFSASADEMKTIVLADSASRSEAGGVVVDGDVVRIMKPGEYIVSGTLTNGCISVECGNDAKVKLFLNSVNIHNETGPAIYVGAGMSRVTLSLVDLMENTLSSGENLEFTEKDKEPNGVIFSRSDLTITGTGSLAVKAGALSGIVSKDDLRIKGGKVTVEAPNHGIRGKDYVEISNATVIIRAGKDALRTTADDREDRGYISIVNSTVEIACGDDAFSYVTRLNIEQSVISCSIVDDD